MKKEETEDEVIGRVLENVDLHVKSSKNRANQMNINRTKQKKKYFRQPKIYQNNYIIDLVNNKNVLKKKDFADPEDPNH